MECLLILLVLGTYFCVQVSSYAVLPVIQCPDQYDRHAWFNRAIQVCPSDHQQYHCLMVVDEKTAPQYAEFCMTAQTIRKGEYVVYSNATNGTVHQRCPEDKYQPVDRKSNDSMAFRCSRPKSTCNLEGQLQCDDGSPEKDRKCRCDFQAGYTLEAFTYENPDKIDCVLPRVVQLTCTKLDMCEDGQELNTYYQCVKKCPDGYYRPDGFGCHELPNNMSSSKPETTAIPTMMTTTQNDDSDVLKQGGESNNSPITALIIVGVFVILMVILTTVIICHFRHKIFRKCKMYRNPDSHPGDANHHTTCCNFTYMLQRIHIEEVENLAVGDKAKMNVSEHQIPGKKKTKKTPESENEKDDPERLNLLDTENEASGLSTDGNKEETDVKNAESTDPKETLSSSQELNTEGSVEERVWDNVNKTVPKENSADKELCSGSKVEGGNDPNTTISKETVNTKGDIEEGKEESSPDCNEYMKDMKLAAEKKGWAVVDVPKDGSCFYHCVLELYTTRNGWDVSTLRKKLKKYLESNSKHYKDFVSDPWETYLSGIESNRWADHLEIKAMAEMLKVSIVVYKLSSSGSELEIKEDIKIQNSHDEPMNIGHIVVNKEGFHFVALKQQVLIRS